MYETDARRKFDESGARAAQLFAAAVAEPLWAFDKRSVETTLEGLSSWPGFAYATVHDASGLFARVPGLENGPLQGDPRPALSPSGPAPRMWAYAYFEAPISHPNQGVLGRFTVAFDQGPMEHAIWMARRNAVFAAVFGFSMLGFLLTLIARSVTKPLVDITQAVEQVAAGDLSYELPVGQALDEVRRLARALEVFRTNAGRLVDAKAEAEANRMIAELAMRDELTGLANRRAVLERFAILEGSVATCDQRRIAMIHVDLDGFKQINDTVGHKAGDHVLREVATRFSDAAGNCSLIARFGGDEFVFLIEDHESRNAPVETAEKIIGCLQAPILFEDQRLRVAASAGVAHHRFGEDVLEETLVNADIALYRAKAQGKGCAVEFDETHRQDLIQRRRASDEILDSVEHHRFVPYFQGIFEAGTQKLASVELLARWHHPQRGLLPPAEFLDVATDLKLMRLIDKQVLEQAIYTFRDLAQRGLTLPRLSVNVSVTRLIEPDFVKMLSEARDSGIEIELELLEAIFLDDPPDLLMWQLDRVRELGVRVSIDDFGTGHASVAGLIKIRPDKVKLDRQFVAPMLESERAFSLVKTLHLLCEQLDIATVAEGVETQEHARLLHSLGCQYLQGFALMRPQPAQALTALLEDLALRDVG
ncbi:MAG: EAL domain-containing protein [Pseudomonadota bacterium]